MIRGLLRFLAFLVLILAGEIAAAQVDDPRQAQLAAWSEQLDQVSAALHQTGLSHPELDAYYSRAVDIGASVGALQNELAPDIADVQSRLDGLAPAPGETRPESDIVRRGRDEQQGILDLLKSLSRQAGIVSLRAGELAAAIADERSERFTRQVFARGPSLLTPTAWRQIGATLPALVGGFQRTFGTWVGRVGGWETHPFAVLGAIFLVCTLAGLLIARLALRFAYRRRSEAPPTRPERMAVGAVVVFAGAGVPALVFIAIHELLDATGYLQEASPTLIHVIGRAVVTFGGVWAIAIAFLAPHRPRWRIINVSDTAAIDGSRLIGLAGLLAATIAFLRDFAATPESAAATGALLGVALAVIVVLTARIIESGAGAARKETAPTGHGHWLWLPPLAIFAAIAIVAAAVIGHLAFAAFLALQIAWTWVIVGLAVLAIGLADRGILLIFTEEGPIGRNISTSFMMTRRLLDEVAIVASGVVRLLIIVLAILTIASPWGIDSTDLETVFAGILAGFTVGGITISFQSIATGLALFLAVVIAARLFQSWLGSRFLPVTGLDVGLKNSILTATSYVGIVIAAVVALTFAGIGLSNIAIIAGALSVGIGFGLQNIVNDFVSGLILLAERPIRTGDWIIVGSNEGVVRRISVRATEIETFDRASVIIPNSNIVSGVVTNMILRNSMGRISITIGVGYDSDPEKVRQILISCAADHALVVKDPAPGVLFADFGASALTFILTATLADISDGTQVSSDLRFSILARLRAGGIEIPFPQQDLNLRDWPRIERALLASIERAGATTAERIAGKETS